MQTQTQQLSDEIRNLESRLQELRLPIAARPAPIDATAQQILDRHLEFERLKLARQQEADNIEAVLPELRQRLKAREAEFAEEEARKLQAWKELRSQAAITNQRLDEFLSESSCFKLPLLKVNDSQGVVCLDDRYKQVSL